MLPTLFAAPASLEPNARTATTTAWGVIATRALPLQHAVPKILSQGNLISRRAPSPSAPALMLSSELIAMLEPGPRAARALTDTLPRKLALPHR